MKELWERLEQGATLATANRRLSRTLGHRYERWQREQGRRVWETPDILPWSAWLQRSWEAMPAAEQVLLTGTQALALWQRLVDASPRARGLIQRAGAARLAWQAWGLQQAWRLEPAAEPAWLNEDSRAYVEWSGQYRELCRRQGWLDEAGLPDALAAAAREGALVLPPVLILCGFDDFTPQQEALITALEQAGCRVEPWEAPRHEAVPLRLSLPSAAEEVATAARWARHGLEQDPETRIGVVVPDLGGLRRAVEYAFEDLMQPQAVLPGAGGGRPFNLSLGEPLTAYSLIHSAFDVLELLQGGLPLEQCGGLLRSPFLAGAEQERDARALLDARLRRRGELQVSLGGLIFFSHGAGPDGDPADYACPRLHEALLRLRHEREALPSRSGAAGWARLFSRALEAMGWPGERGLDSVDHQLWQAWGKLLDEFAALEAVSPPAPAAAALAQLRRMAGERLFQPKTPEVPVQILGVLETAGLDFDALWIMGLHDEAWPEAPRPNPFLPIEHQRRLGLPRASAERELEVARRITRRLLAAAPRVVLSYPAQEGDRELRPSPLIAQLKEIELAELALPHYPVYRELVHRAGRREDFEDGRGPRIEGSRAEGGSTLFKLQAACPFRAFAEIRLGARPLGAPGVGLDPQTRGTLVHRALERLWRALESREHLAQTPEPELERFIADAVQVAVAEAAREHPDIFSRRFTGIEQARLQNLLRDWLQRERERPPFRVVGFEQECQLEVDGVRVRTVIDRVDRLPDGRRLIIDYKTGVVDTGQWFDERPEEPQLPLYSLGADASLAGVAVAQVRRGDMQFKGVASEEGLLPGVRAVGEHRACRELGDWESLRGFWRRNLEGLARAFREGEARVDPKRPPQTCRYCALTPLCRVHECLPAGGGEAGEEET